MVNLVQSHGKVIGHHVYKPRPRDIIAPLFSGNRSSFLSRYIAFDFHKECSRMRWHRLQILVDMVAETQDEFG